MNIPKGTPIVRSEVGDDVFKQRYDAPLQALQRDTQWLVQRGVPADEIVYVEGHGGLYLDLKSAAAMLHQVPFEKCHWIRNDPQDDVVTMWAGDIIGIARVLKEKDTVYVYQHDQNEANPVSMAGLQALLMNKILHCQACTERYSRLASSIARN